MRKITLFLMSLFLTVGAMAQIEQNKCYHITSKDPNRGAFYAKPGEGYLSHCGGTYGNYLNKNISKDKTSTAQQFAFVSYNGKLYLYSVSEKKFAKKEDNFVKLVERDPDFVTIVQNVNGSYYNIKINDTNKLNFSGGYTYGVYANYNNDDDGNNLVITEAGSFDPTEARLMLSDLLENDMTLNWTASTAWTKVAIKDQTATVLTDNRLNGVDPSFRDYEPFIGYIEHEINISGARTAETKFEYTSGGCALNMRGVEVIDKNGNIVAADYHVGKSGTPPYTNNVYTVNVAEAGTYKVRCYATFDGQNRHNATNGTITISFARATATKFSKDVTFTAEYATLHLGYKVAIPQGVKAYVAVSTDNGHVQFKEVTGVIPAATPVLLENVGSETTTYTFAYTDAAATAVETNLLKGSIENRYVVGGAYVLGYINEEGATPEIGFGKAVTEGLDEGTFLNNANKAYLPATSVTGASLSANLRFDFGGTTAIEEVETEAAETVIYDLTGRRVNEITKAGVYVVNGKKILVK